MNRAILCNEWQTLYNCPPPIQSNTEFLRQAVGWQLQAETLGGLDASSRKALKSGSLNKTLSPGTKLVRHWQNASYQVTVTDNGFEHNGKNYRSLSAIAKVITGTNWNGHVFFGVKS
ncbi:DUF2924 domain-containing protein [Methylotenera sp. 1P/1]|uniref:DUF2924 domain-containing protein n=1 Tax=Methylotenera sp. 1P/1 TaxID=1131551 RepID=UPI00038159A2|nr:DUF2924 domain-containing protein [Methylotenera sp. 1P/1]